MWRCWLILLAGCGRIAFDEATTVACPSNYIDATDGCYRVVVDPFRASWLDAEQACEADGGHLVVVDSQAELDQIIQIIAGVDDLWIGASARRVTLQYVAVTDRPFFFAWDAIEPNATGACVEIDGGVMDDHDCGTVNDYICEIDGVTADPSRY
jgi:hypothetical protein